MSRALDTIDVYADPDYLPGPTRMGTLRRQASGRGEVYSFAYDSSWLRMSQALAFDPDLALVEGPQYAPAERAQFGVFLDSAPDRWGRVLMQRREAILARAEARRPRALTDWDFLLGVHDETRLGALRFRADVGGPFLDADDALSAPPLTSLGELQAASLALEERGETDEGPEAARWLAHLLAPGTSLGGARPKATVRDDAGRLCIAKFPSTSDRRDSGAWELVAHQIAAAAGIRVAPCRALRLPGSRYATFLARRFDRTDSGRRRAFVSAMTLTQRRDGEEGASYLELVDLLQSRGSRTREDSLEIFRRVLLNILIHNTDDHLRNHGFFVEPAGLRLAPAYDLNPSVDRTALTLAIDEVNASCDVDVAMSAHRLYGLTAAEAENALGAVRAALATWRELAARVGVPRAEQTLMEPAFGQG